MNDKERMYYLKMQQFNQNQNTTALQTICAIVSRELTFLQNFGNDDISSLKEEMRNLATKIVKLCEQEIDDNRKSL